MGRGIADMKGGIASMLVALEVLAARRRAPRRRRRLLHRDRRGVFRRRRLRRRRRRRLGRRRHLRRAHEHGPLGRLPRLADPDHHHPGAPRPRRDRAAALAGGGRGQRDRQAASRARRHRPPQRRVARAAGPPASVRQPGHHRRHRGPWRRMGDHLSCQLHLDLRGDVPADPSGRGRHRAQGRGGDQGLGRARRRRRSVVRRASAAVGLGRRRGARGGARRPSHRARRGRGRRPTWAAPAWSRASTPGTTARRSRVSATRRPSASAPARVRRRIRSTSGARSTTSSITPPRPPCSRCAGAARDGERDTERPAPERRRADLRRARPGAAARRRPAGRRGGRARPVRAAHARLRRRAQDRSRCAPPSPPASPARRAWTFSRTTSRSPAATRRPSSRRSRCSPPPATSSSSRHRPTTSRSARCATTPSTVAGVPCDGDGLDVDALADDAAASARRRPEGRPACTSSRPSTIRREAALAPIAAPALVDLARREDLLVIEDDVYRELAFEAPDAAFPLVARPRGAGAAPRLVLEVARARPADRLARRPPRPARALRRGGHDRQRRLREPVQPPTSWRPSWKLGGYDDHIAAAAGSYAARRDALWQALGRPCRPPAPAPAGRRVLPLGPAAARRHGDAPAPRRGSATASRSRRACASPLDGADDHARLAFSLYDEEALRESAARLATALSDLG